MRITLVSDIICPWCFIGKTRLQRAIQSLQLEDQIDLSISPFQLYPDIPLSGKLRSTLPKKKGHGSLLREAADPLGIEFRWDLIERIPNTLAIHEALFEIREKDRWAAKQALFEGYFGQGMDLTLEDQLEEVLAPFQKADEGERAMDISTLIDQNRQRGITVVPTFIVDDEHLLTGAIEKHRWENFLQRRLRKT